MKVNNTFFQSNKVYFWIIGICIVLMGLLAIVERYPVGVELYYSRGVYPFIEYFNKFLFGWIPFSVGDLFYITFVIFLIYSVIKIFVCTFRGRWFLGSKYIFRLLSFLFVLYTFFYLNWGLNYFREPLYQSMNLDVQAVTKQDYLDVLTLYIEEANALRKELNMQQYSKNNTAKDIEQLMLDDTVFSSILSKTQVHIKHPISSRIVSYFTVSGYFNPFTSEVQVNQEIPLITYPFVNVHELAHQMGIGFEDDCNFIAFRKLINHPNPWYRYSAYYNSIQSLFESVYSDPDLFEHYKSMLSALVLADLKEESDFWKSHRGWIDQISSVFYDNYLQHNNQPEGLERYSMMSRLIVAWEKQQ